MHELAITESLLEIVLQQAEKNNAQKVINVNLVVGELSGAEDECVQSYFGFLSKDTIASGAMLSFRHVPVRTHCHDCEASFCPNELKWVCPGCGSSRIEVVGGRELYVESMEIE